MLNEENLNKLYTSVINDEELTTKKLNSYNLNSKDLNTLIEQKVLERTKRGYYNFLSLDNLYNYGKQLIIEKNLPKAINCFEKCYEINSNDYETCLQLFFNDIYNDNYEHSIKYLDKFLNCDNPLYKADANFYVYLLSLIVKLPDKYRNYAEIIKLKDVLIKVDDPRYKDVNLQNEIRTKAMEKRFSYAIKQLINLNKKNNESTIEMLVINSLLFRIKSEETKNQKIMLELLREEKYEEAKKFLEFKSKQHKLNIVDSLSHRLIKRIINLQKTEKIPIIKLTKGTSVFKAIKNNDFSLAIELSKKYHFDAFIDDSENIITILLYEICNNIDKIKEKQKKEITDNNIINSSTNDNNSNITNSYFQDILIYLMNSEIDKAFNALKNYMKVINKEEYEFLIINLIKLSLLENDKAFTKPMTTLSYMSRSDFKFDISNYIQEFYIKLSEKKVDEAKIYIDIITKSNEHGYNNINIVPLLDAISKIEVQDKTLMITDKNNDLNIKLKDTDKSKSTTNLIVENKELEPVEEDKTNLTKEKDYDEEFIDSKHEFLLENDGIILLKPMKEERIEKIHIIVKKYSDMASFTIGDDNNKRIVLRYKPFVEKGYNVSELSINGNKAYKEKRYDDCIENYIILLHFRNPRAYVYAMLGLAYMKKREAHPAIEYLTVATELSKTEEKRLDFSEIIDLLKNPIEKYSKKPNFEMQEKDFNNDIENNYGITNIDKITSYVLESGLDVETACHNLNLSNEQIDIVRLIYAKTYYTQGNYEKGDQFLKVVERSNNKTKYINKLLDELRKNKKFYINRANDNKKTLSLALKPKK